MEYSQVMEVIKFTSDILFLFVSFMSGMVLGYMVGRIDQEF